VLSGRSTCAAFDDFLPSAARGRACPFLNEETGKRGDAIYSVDGETAEIHIHVTQEGTPRDIAFPIHTIEDIYQIEDGDECFAPTLLASLAPEERSRLFVIVFLLEAQSTPQAVCLLEESSQARDTLLELLRLLCG